MRPHRPRPPDRITPDPPTPYTGVPSHLVRAIHTTAHQIHAPHHRIPSVPHVLRASAAKGTAAMDPRVVESILEGMWRMPPIDRSPEGRQARGRHYRRVGELARVCEEGFVTAVRRVKMGMRREAELRGEAERVAGLRKGKKRRGGRGKREGGKGEEVEGGVEGGEEGGRGDEGLKVSEEVGEGEESQADDGAEGSEGLQGDQETQGDEERGEEEEREGSVVRENELEDRKSKRRDDTGDPIPDILFNEGTIICGVWCNWIEYKSFFGYRADPYVFLKCEKQFERYRAVFGPGLVVYRLGFETGMPLIEGVTRLREAEVVSWLQAQPREGILVDLGEDVSSQNVPAEESPAGGVVRGSGIEEMIDGMERFPLVDLS